MTDTATTMSGPSPTKEVVFLDIKSVINGVTPEEILGSFWDEKAAAFVLDRKGTKIFAIKLAVVTAEPDVFLKDGNVGREVKVIKIMVLKQLWGMGAFPTTGPAERPTPKHTLDLTVRFPYFKFPGVNDSYESMLEWLKWVYPTINDFKGYMPNKKFMLDMVSFFVAIWPKLKAGGLKRARFAIAILAKLLKTDGFSCIKDITRWFYMNGTHYPSKNEMLNGVFESSSWKGLVEGHKRVVTEEPVKVHPPKADREVHSSASGSQDSDRDREILDEIYQTIVTALGKEMEAFWLCYAYGRMRISAMAGKKANELINDTVDDVKQQRGYKISSIAKSKRVAEELSSLQSTISNIKLEKKNVAMLLDKARAEIKELKKKSKVDPEPPKNEPKKGLLRRIWGSITGFFSKIFG